MDPGRCPYGLRRGLVSIGQTLIRLRNGSQRRPEINRQQLELHAALRILLPILFPIIQRRHGDFGVFRAGMMYRLGIVPQRLLRDSSDGGTGGLGAQLPAA